MNKNLRPKLTDNDRKNISKYSHVCTELNNKECIQEEALILSKAIRPNGKDEYKQ